MQKPEKPVLPTRKIHLCGFFGLSVHRAVLKRQMTILHGWSNKPPSPARKMPSQLF